MFTRASQDMHMVADQLAAAATATGPTEADDNAKKYRLRVAQRQAEDAEALAKETTIAAEDAASKAAQLAAEAQAQAAAIGEAWL